MSEHYISQFPKVRAMGVFMTLRHQVYLDRIAGKPAPWTDDPVLNKYRFCNIFRELDTVTVWIRKNIREPFANHPDLWFMLAIARYINHPETLAEMIDTKQWPSHPDFEPSWITTALEHRAARGDKVYTGAYMIRAESDRKKHWYNWSKHRYIGEIVLGRLWEQRDQIVALLQGELGEATLEGVWDRVCNNSYFIGWGGFMTYEWVTDLRHTRYLCNAPDIHTWANAGPGAVRGLNRLFERPLDHGIKKDASNKEMRLLMDWMNDYHNGAWPVAFPRLEMRDVEHSLCEFDKYQRVLAGEGKPRSIYQPMKAGQLRVTP